MSVVKVVVIMLLFLIFFVVQVDVMLGWWFLSLIMNYTWVVVKGEQFTL